MLISCRLLHQLESQDWEILNENLRFLNGRSPNLLKEQNDVVAPKPGGDDPR
jgi:hypothetical protein